MKIKQIIAHEILASGGYPTIEACVTLENEISACASVAYGSSAGSHEAVMLTDQDPQRYGGKGVLQAVKNVVKIIAPQLIDQEATDQRAIDNMLIKLDGTENKSKLGGNATLAVSLAVAKAVAKSNQLPFYQYLIEYYQTGVDLSQLPNPMVVVIEGGKHAHQTTDLQEYCLSALGADGPTANIQRVLESYHQLKSILQEEGLSTNVGNEGAFAPNGIPNNEAPLKYIEQAISQAGYQPGQDIGISIDAAASEFYQDGFYNLSIENKKLTGAELIAYYEQWFKKYSSLITVEDMLAEDDWDNWVKLNQVCKKYNLELIGDDLTVTDQIRLQKAIDLQAISSILIKLNQIGTLTETVDTCLLARRHNMMTVPSHRGGGETNDTSMVDLAVAVGSRFIKVGPTRGERISKYNRLLAIERELTK